MATRRSPALLLLLIAAGVLVTAGAWWLLDSGPSDHGGGEAAPITSLVDPGPAAPRAMPAPIDIGPAPEPAEPPPRRVGELVGRVIDHNRVAVTDARVSLFEGARSPVGGLSRALPAMGFATQVDETGAFRFEQVPESARVVVRVQGPGFEATESGAHPIVAGQVTDVGAVSVGPGLAVAGVVLGERGLRLEGARVLLGLGEVPAWGAPDPVPLAETTTDENGQFLIEHAPRSIFFLEASAAGYGRSAVSQDLLADATQTSVSFTLRLEPAADLRGRVVAADDGRPLPDVEVRVDTGGQNGGLSTRARSGADGRFTMRDLSPGRYQVVTDPVGFLLQKATTQVDTFGDELTLALEAASAIEGRVVDTDGRPLGAFDLNLRATNRNGDIGDTVGTVRRVRDRQGHFRADDLEPGLYLLEVWAKDHAVSFSSPVRVRKGQDTKGVELTMTPSATLAGQVVDDLGEPIAGALVSLNPNRSPTAPLLRQDAEKGSWHQLTRTDAKGAFELRNVTAAAYQLEVDHRDYPVAFHNDVVARAGERTQLDPIVLPRPATVTGSVIGVGGQLLVGVRVMLGGGDSRQTSLETATDGAGRYRFDRLEPGAYTIRCFSPDANPFESMKLEIKRIQKDEEGKPHLPPDFVVQAGEVLEHLVRADS